MLDLHQRRAGVPPLSDLAAAWLKRDGKVAVATIIDTWGSAPVPTGGQMIIGADGQFEGSVSGGCVEGEVITEAGELLEGAGGARTLAFGVEDATAWRVGLPCGGRIQVHVERLAGAADQAFLEQITAARAARRGLLIEMPIDGGARQVYARDTPGLAPDLRCASARARAGSRNGRAGECSCMRCCRRRAFWSSARRTWRRRSPNWCGSTGSRRS